MKVEEKLTNKEKRAVIIRKYQQYLKLEKALSPNTLDAYMTDLQKLLHFLEGETIEIADVAPDEPEVTRAVDAAQKVGDPVGWLEDNFGNQVAGQARLARDTEFGGEIRVDAGNVVHGRPPVVACDYHNTSAEKCKFLLHFQKNGVK